jgi:hypothetical protein
MSRTLILGMAFTLSLQTYIFFFPFFFLSCGFHPYLGEFGKFYTTRGKKGKKKKKKWFTSNPTLKGKEKGECHR